jgi:uncharacterized protein
MESLTFSLAMTSAPTPMLAAALVTGQRQLILAVAFGAVFGFLLHRGSVTDYNVIVNQFRLRDFTVMKVMLTAILVGGVGVAILVALGWAQLHVRAAAMLAVSVGGLIFGVGMVLYGYCPGTGVAAIATGSVHALVGAGGMLVGAAAYALSYNWMQQHVLGVANLGNVRLDEVTAAPAWAWFILIAAAVAALAWLTGRTGSLGNRSTTGSHARPAADK